MRRIKLSKFFILGVCILMMAVVSFASVGAGPTPAVNDLVGGAGGLWCGLGTGVAAGLGIGAFVAAATGAGAPVAAALGIGGILVGAVTAAFC